MDELSVISCDLYRGYVREKKILCLTSAPLRRNKNWVNCLGFTSGETSPDRRRRVAARHPWIFAWTQNRLMLPAWLGAGRRCKKWSKMANRASWKPCAGLAILLDASRHAGDGLRQSRLWLAEYYDQRLVDNALWPLGKSYAICKKKTSKWCWRLPTISPDGRSAVDCRVYSATEYLTDPLNVLQAELLHRSRQAEKKARNRILASSRR